MQGHSHHHATGMKKIRFAFYLNLGFTAIEIAGGTLTNSVAILSDAVHDLGDSITLALSWQLEKLSERGRTEKQTFGYRRYSVLGALVSTLILMLGSVFILSRALPRLFSPQPVEPRGMIVIAVLGVVINTVAVLRLRGGQKLNERVVFLHLMEDVLGWIAVLAISIVLLFVDIPILDPILSIVITIYILTKIFPILKSAFKVFLQYVPAGSDVEAVRSRLVELEDVQDVHDVHLWSLDGTYTVFSAHFVIDKDLSIVELERIKGEARRTLHGMGIHHTTIEFEASDNVCEECDLE